MKQIEKELDKLVQMLCINHYCHVCGKHNAEAIHHIIGRANKVLRYDFVNLLPVCHECHRKIHDTVLDVLKYVTPERWQYLQEIKNKSYRDLLIFELGQTEDEFLKYCKEQIKRTINERDKV